MNTKAYENETRELTIAELDAVSGGENGPLLPVILGVLREYGVDAPTTPSSAGMHICGRTGGGVQ
jgi:hypothetical protein